MGFSKFLAGLLGTAAVPGPAPAAKYDLAELMQRVDSRSGYQREAAIKTLGRLRHGPAIARLLVRANDWVPQVREAAALALRDMLDEAFAADWLDALESLVELERAGRTNLEALRDDIAVFLAHGQRLAAVNAAASHGSRALKRYAFELEWRAAGDDDAPRLALLRITLAGEDLANARRAMLFMQNLGSADERRPLLEAARRSRFSGIRAEGLRRTLVQRDASSLELALPMSLDPRASVRTIALNALRARGGLHRAVEQAAALLRTPTPVPAGTQVAALQCLCEADPAGSLVHCAAVGSSAPVALRCVALAQLIGSATGEARETLLLRAFADPSPKVQRLAVKAVSRGALLPPADQLITIALRHDSAAALRRAFLMLARVSAWTRLQWLMSAARGPLPLGGAELCVAELEHWVSDAMHNFAQPSPEQREALAAQWLPFAPLLPPVLRARIACQLQVFGMDLS